MTGSERAALLGCLAALVLTSFGLGAYTTSLTYPEQERYQSYGEATSNKNEASLVAADSHSPERRTPCVNPKTATDSDLCAQWRAAVGTEKAAEWAMWGGLATGFGIIGLIITIILSLRALVRAKEANEIARESGVAQDRAWVKLSVTATQISVTRDHILTRAKVKTKNVGNSVALDVTCWASLHIGHTGDFMDKGFFDSLPPQFYGSQQSYVIWPDGSLSHDRNANGLGISTHEITGNNYRVYLLATAEYRTIFDKPTDPKRRTELIVELKRSEASFVIAEDIQITSEVHRLVYVRHSNIGSGEVT